MPTYKRLLDQIVASTKHDLQGEHLSREALENLVARYPKRVPLHQRHDLSLRTIGYLENYRLDEDEEEPGHYSIRADVTILADIDPDLRGFSISFTEKLASNSDSPKHFVYLPYPLYNDSALIEHLLTLDPEVYVGKFVKKQLDPISIGLIGTGLVFLLAPEWEIQYRERVRPALVKVVSWLGMLRSRGASADLVQYVIGRHGEEIQIIFIPGRGFEERCFDSDSVESAIAKAKRFIDGDQKAEIMGVKRIKFLWDPAANCYSLLHVEYADGTDCHHV